MTVFLDHPEVAMDNNAAERALRGPVVGRKNYYGSGSRWSARLAAVLFTILHTLQLWEINPQRWLSCYLECCAESGNRAPPQLTRFLPWEMNPAQRADWSRPAGREAA
ncbi:MAG: transposase [Candidatus Acidoferrales bacterium]